MLFLWLLCGFVAVLLVEAAPVQVSLVYKHKLGGKFAQAGEDIVRVQLSGNTRLRLAWDATPAALADLQKLAAADELYSFSVSAAEPAAGQDAPVPLQGDVMFSLPARCFAASLRGKHRLDFHVGTDGKLVGMQWRFPKSLDCSTYGALAAWPQATDAKAVLPVPGEDLTTVQNLAPPDKADAAFQGGLLPPSQAQDGPRLQPDGTAAPGGPGGKPPPKEKTFMEKNWILILGIGFLGMNLLIGKPPPSSGGQGQGQGPARPAQSVSR